ncbi:MAG: SNF2-related protein [Allomuricauda sp.]
MKYSKKKYLDFMVRTIEALHNSNAQGHAFINNPGFGNIFDILKNEKYRERFLSALKDYVGDGYMDTILDSLKKGSLNSFYTPMPVIRAMADYLTGIPYFSPRTILEPSAGNGLIIRELLRRYPRAKVTAFEKEILTARILEHNFGHRDNVRVFGIPFEGIGQSDAAKSYDLVISNIPFGANKVFDPDLADHPLRDGLTSNVHSYFVHKSLESVKPGGMVVLICTKNFLDKAKYGQIRENIIKGNDFLGGVRLPDNAFAQENTSVVTDILVFQKSSAHPSLEQKERNRLFMKSAKVDLDGNEIQLSAYFDAHPENILGTMEPGGLYDHSDYTVRNPNNIATIEPAIREALTTFRPSITKSRKVTEKKTDKASVLGNPQQSYEGPLRPGNLIVAEQKIAKITDSGQYYYLKTKPAEFDKLTKIISLRDTCLQLLDPKVEDGRKIWEDLNYQYDVFLFQYGNLNDKANYHLVTLDVQGPLVLALESPEKGTFTKGQFLLTPWASQMEESPERLSLQDAIYFSLNRYNRIDIDAIAGLTDMAKETVIGESLSQGLLFIDPTEDGCRLAPKYLFLSGVIHKKIQWYRKNDFGEFRSFVDKDILSRSILELEKVNPPITPFEDLDIKLHEPWFPIEMTQSFIFDTYGTLAHIDYNETTSKYMVKIEKYDYASVKKFYVHSEHRSYNFKDILEGALNSTIPYISKGSGDFKRTDKTKMQEVNIKFEIMYREFNEYVIGNSELKKSLEFRFYSIYDAKIMPKYDGSYLEFQGLRHFEPYHSQKDTVAGIIINQGLLVNKEVGFGKTLDMALSTEKLRELGLSKRTVIIGLRSTVVQLEKEFRNAFPQMKLLVANDREVAGLQKRNAFFSKVVSQRPDVVLMSHDTFKFIPQSPEIIKEIIQEELDNLERDLGVIYENKYDINKRVLKGLEVRKENLEAQLQNIYHQIEKGKDNILTFDQLGFEHIMVDESHKFKNLMYTTRHSRVAGLNTSTGSERSKNLYTAIRTLQRSRGKDFQATFLSGTPISNSITEVYVLFKYLIPERLKEMNIASFDQWAQVFANKSYEFEPTVSGDYKVRERFRSFKKMKLLSTLYNEISIIVNAQTHHIDRPKAVMDVHTIKPTEGQLAYFEQIKTFLRTGKSEHLYGNKTYTEDQKGALSLIALHHMRHASIDPRLLNPDLEDPGETKLRIIAREVYRTYTESNDFKGTQAIFSDLGTPKETFNVYSEIKRILTEEYDVPTGEVVFIHDFKTDGKRLQCFDDLNLGKYRIIIGSTEKLGTGTNIQRRMVRIHHVDIPHRPTDVDQRNGRGARKGNEMAKKYWDNKVTISFYIVENSTDALMLNNVNTKKNFIEQITNGTIQFNRLDMGPVDDNGSIDYKTLLAVAKNDPLFLEKEQLGKRLEELQLERSIFKRNRLEAENNIRFHSREQEKVSKNIEKLERDLPLWQLMESKKTYYGLVKNAMGLPLNAQDTDIGQAIIDFFENRKGEASEHQVLKMDGASLCIRIEDVETHSLFVRTDNATYGHGARRIVTNPKSVADYMYNALSKIPRSVKGQKELALDHGDHINANQKILDLDFDKSEELKEMETRMEQINGELDKKFDVDISGEEPKETKASKTLSENVGIDHSL